MANSAWERSACAAGALSERLRRVSCLRSSAVSGRRGSFRWRDMGHLGARGSPRHDTRSHGNRPTSMASYGYARVSTTDQALALQEAALRAAGCEMIRAERRSGTTTAGRSELQTLLDFARKGDVIVVTRIDRLARSLADLAA